MNVDFNNLRRKALIKYDDLVKTLNEHIEDDKVIIDTHLIEEQLASLRMLIGTIACVSVEGDDNFKDVFSELYPEDNDGCMEIFNNKED